MPSPLPFANRLALVTGAGRRLGRAIALDLAAAGADVAVHYHTSADGARETAELVRAAGRRAWLLPADLSSPTEAAGLIAAAVAAAKAPVELLVNNAAAFPTERLDELTAESLARVVQLNAFAPLQIIRAFAAQFPDAPAGDGPAPWRPGAVNLLDCRMVDADPQHAGYHAAKKMLHGFTLSAAREYAPRVRVNGVAPGLILPPEGQGEEYLRRLAGSNPLRTWGAAGDVAAAVRFLLESAFVTGQTVFVDGGRHLRGGQT